MSTACWPLTALARGTIAAARDFGSSIQSVASATPSPRAGGFCSQIGDLNFDTIVDICDFLVLNDAYTSGTYDLCADLNEDGFVDALDYLSLSNLFDRGFVECFPFRGGSPPASPPGGSRNSQTIFPISNGHLVIAAKDDLWEDHLYEVDPVSGLALQAFGAPANENPVYAAVRQDFHGAFFAANLTGKIEMYDSSGGMVVESDLVPSPPPALLELRPLDIAFAPDGTSWVLYSPTADTFLVGGSGADPQSHAVHYNAAGVMLDSRTHPSHNYGRNIGVTREGGIWSTTAESGACGSALFELSADPVVSQTFNACSPSDPLPGVQGLAIRRGGRSLTVGSTKEPILRTYAVVNGMPDLAAPQTETMIPNMDVITDVTEDIFNGDLYVTGVAFTGNTIQPRLFRIPSGTDTPIEINLSVSGGLPPIQMAVSLIVYRDYVKGDYDQDGDVDHADFSDFVACYSGPGGGIPNVLPDCSAFDYDGDMDVDLTDYLEIQNAFSGPF